MQGFIENSHALEVEPKLFSKHSRARGNGINILMLWGAVVEAGYHSSFWMTFKQAHDLAGVDPPVVPGAFKLYRMPFSGIGQSVRREKFQIGPSGLPSPRPCEVLFIASQKASGYSDIEK